MSALETLWAVFTWPFRQFWGFLSNLWTWVSEGLRLKDITVPAVYDTLVWLSNQVPLALGGGSPGEMIEASAVLAVTSFFTGFVTGGLAWALIIFFVFTGFLGFWRFVPVVEKYWLIPEFRIGDRGSLGVLSG